MNMNRVTRTNLRLQSASLGLILFLLVLLLAYASHRYPLRWDWTTAQRNSLAEQSIKAIKAFDKGINATVYVQEQGEQRTHLQNLLEKYRAANPELQVRFVDPDLDPSAARQADVAMYGTIVFRAGDKTEKLTESNEESVTNALIRLSKGGSKTIRFISGHGEHSFSDKAEPIPERKSLSGGAERLAYSKAVSLLKGEGYQVLPINLAESEKIPEGTVALVLAGARSTLLPVEVERLQQWWEAGGRLLFLHGAPVRTGLEEWMKKLGITMLEGLVVDPVARLFGGGVTTPLVNQYDGDHPITRNLQAASFFPEARGLRLEEGKGDDKAMPSAASSAVRLLSGAERGWLKVGYNRGGDNADTAALEFNPNVDQRGPILLGVTLQQEKKRLVVVGNSNFAADAYVGFSGNTDLFLNMVRWLAEDENFIAIKAKEVTDSGLVLSQEGGLLLFGGLVLTVPLALLLLGFTIWRKRKNL
ncbi:GldG family protein [Candidatus Magnetaquicoccus inordinatus]|uniref:GldG family protein n=1 Tax=Candidatus Magnetaquicoccus inordinatus TaxID=2496818 RepID=UPI00102CC2D8|nr:GldG family protein [Candidatus Magnetaquicoccus inordinatus]